MTNAEPTGICELPATISRSQTMCGFSQLFFSQAEAQEIKYLFAMSEIRQESRLKGM